MANTQGVGMSESKGFCGVEKARVKSKGADSPPTVDALAKNAA